MDSAPIEYERLIRYGSRQTLGEFKSPAWYANSSARIRQARLATTPAGLAENDPHSEEDGPGDSDEQRGAGRQPSKIEPPATAQRARRDPRSTHLIVPRGDQLRHGTMIAISALSRFVIGSSKQGFTRVSPSDPPPHHLEVLDGSQIQADPARCQTRRGTISGGGSDMPSVQFQDHAGARADGTPARLSLRPVPRPVLPPAHGGERRSGLTRRTLRRLTGKIALTLESHVSRLRTLERCARRGTAPGRSVAC